MSAWRRKAIEMCPEFRHEFEKPETTIHGAFFELLPRVTHGHENPTDDEVERIYMFAEWYFRQKSFELSNAAAVSFYEHLGNSERTQDQRRRWLAPDIYRDVRTLLVDRVEPDRLAALDRTFKITSK